MRAVASAKERYPSLAWLVARPFQRALGTNQVPTTHTSNVQAQVSERTGFQRERRNLLRNMLGFVALSAGALTLLGLGSVFNKPAETGASNPSVQTSTTVSDPTGQNRRLLAKASDIPLNESSTLNDPTLGPILLIHLDNEQFVAYSSICTHAGCLVRFDPLIRNITCHCCIVVGEYSAFDPYNNAQVVGGPAPFPLQKIPIQYDPATGNIYLTG